HTRSYGDWSSDVCSSDLNPGTSPLNVATAYGTSKATRLWTVSAFQVPVGISNVVSSIVLIVVSSSIVDATRIVAGNLLRAQVLKIGRASCRERVEISVGE